MITRTRTDFFISRFVGNNAVIDITIEAGKTYPIIFGIGTVFGATFWPEVLAYNYKLQANDIDYLYDLRKLNISGSKRVDHIMNYNIKTFPFKLAAKAILWMEQSPGPSKEFVKWTKENADDLQIELEEGIAEGVRITPFDVYKIVK